MAAYPVIWSSDIKSNIINELLDPENLKTVSTWFYFDELEPTFVSVTIFYFFKMEAVSSHVTTQQQIWCYQWIFWHRKPLYIWSSKSSCIFMHLFKTVLAYHTVTWPQHPVLNCCQIKNKLNKNMANDAFYVFYISLQIHAIALWNLSQRKSYTQKSFRSGLI